MAKTLLAQAKKYKKRAQDEQARILDEESSILEELEREPMDEDGDGLIDIDSDSD